MFKLLQKLAGDINNLGWGDLKDVFKGIPAKCSPINMKNESVGIYYSLRLAD